MLLAENLPRLAAAFPLLNQGKHVLIFVFLVVHSFLLVSYATFSYEKRCSWAGGYVLVGNENGSYYSIFTMSYNSDSHQLTVCSKFREDGIRVEKGEEPIQQIYKLSPN